MSDVGWNWKFVCILLCAVGFFKSMRPSEPFLTNYLNGPEWVNLTLSEIYSEVFPVATYSYLAVIIVVMLLTDFLRYKPIIVCEALAFLGTYLLLIFGKTLVYMQIVEVVYAFGMSCEIAYYTYMYTKVSDKYYQKVTSYSRAAVLTGMFSAGMIGQVLLLSKLMNYAQLNYISLGSACITLVLALCLPRVPKSIYFNPLLRNEDANLNLRTETIPETTSSRSGILNPKPNNFKSFILKLHLGFEKLWLDIKESYKIASVVKWSVWWAFGTCLNTQVINYIQPLWEVIVKEENIGNSTDFTMYNGAVESASTLLGAIAALAVGFVLINWSLYGELVLAAVSVLDAACLALMALTDDLWIAYGSYVVFRVAYNLLITIVSFQVAKDIKSDSYSLIFGCNTFWALMIQTVLNLILVDKIGLEADPRTQFLVYSGFSLCLGSVFFITGIITCIRIRSEWSPAAHNSIIDSIAN